MHKSALHNIALFYDIIVAKQRLCDVAEHAPARALAGHCVAFAPSCTQAFSVLQYTQVDIYIKSGEEAGFLYLWH